MATKLSDVEKVLKEAHGLLGVHEIPNYSNDGPSVHTIQSSTGAYREPWCVSFVQYCIKFALGHTIANDTASVYYLIDYAEGEKWITEKPTVGAPVCYRVGQGHCGLVVQVLKDGSFYAIEGNEENAVRLMHRHPVTDHCVFMSPPYVKG